MDPLLSHMGASHISALLGNDLLETPKPSASEQDAGDLQGKDACVSKTPLGSHGSRLKWGGGGAGKRGPVPSSVGGRRETVTPERAPFRQMKR